MVTAYYTLSLIISGQTKEEQHFRDNLSDLWRVCEAQHVLYCHLNASQHPACQYVVHDSHNLADWPGNGAPGVQKDAI